MGTKPVVGFVGLVCVGLGLTGCASTDKTSTYQGGRGTLTNGAFSGAPKAATPDGWSDNTKSSLPGGGNGASTADSAPKGSLPLTQTTTGTATPTGNSAWNGSGASNSYPMTAPPSMTSPSASTPTTIQKTNFNSVPSPSSDASMGSMDSMNGMKPINSPDEPGMAMGSRTSLPANPRMTSGVDDSSRFGAGAPSTSPAPRPLPSSITSGQMLPPPPSTTPDWMSKSAPPTPASSLPPVQSTSTTPAMAAPALPDTGTPLNSGALPPPAAPLPIPSLPPSGLPPSGPPPFNK